MNNSKKVELPEIIKLLPVEDVVIFPQVILPLHINDQEMINTVDKALSTQDRLIFVVAQNKENEDHYDFGVLCTILKMLKLPDGTTQILVQGLKRAVIKEKIQEEDSISVKIEKVEEIIIKDIEIEALISNLRKSLDEMIRMGKNIPGEFLNYVYNVKNPSHFADLISTILEIDIKNRQSLLEELDVKKRLEKVLIFCNKEINVLSVGKKIQSEVSQKLKSNEKKYLLREQLKAIHKELGEEDEKTKEIQELKEKIEKAKMPEEVKKTAEKELKRFSKMHTDSAEGSVIRTYLENLIEMPWSKKTKDNKNIKKAEKILEESHAGLKKVKERILEFLAVQKLKNKITGPILCLVGPPGVGKTSLGKAVAASLGKNYVRMSLGGVHDESEIRGHRKTYIGAMPGRIMQGIKNAGTNNPVFVLDEIDKLSRDFRGDPASALLEVLDPEQNNSFVDHYLNVPFDLSNVLFIATANTLNTIPPALLDRIEVINISGYTYKEKLEIVKRFLLPKQKENNGIKNLDLKISDKTMIYIIQKYTKEAGVRNIERVFARICRKIALEHAKKNDKQKFVLTSKNIHKYLGAPIYIDSVDYIKDKPGIASGLAWTQYGGEVLYIEAIKRKGKGNFILTGQLGNVMKESAHIAYSYIKTMFSSKKKIDFSSYDVHLHVPAGAIPKDGPSAGITMATALYSLFSDKPVKENIAMTGEISLTGRVLPIGGLKEKSLAAFRDGYKKIIIPAKNLKDIEDIPKEVKKGIQFIDVESYDQIIKEVF